MKNIIRVHALWLASVLTLLFAPTTGEAQKALVYCPAVDQSGCTTVRSALLSAFPGGVDIGDDGANGTVDLRTADLFQYAVFFVPSLAETDSAAPYARLREQVVADRLKAALLGRRAFWSGTPDQGALAATRPQKDQLIQNLAAWASSDFGTVNAPGLVVLQDNSDVVTSRYSWVQAITGFQIIADPKLASYGSVRSLTAAGNAILTVNGSTLAYANMASFGFQTPSGASGVSLDAVGQTGTSVGGQIVLLTQMGANTGGAVIRTDTDDYPPGTPVIMTGTGFQAGETVTLTLHEDPLLHDDRVHTATADANGGFVYSGFSPEDHDVNVRFVLTAKGQSSGRQAQTTFTDANPSNVVLTPNSRTITAGSTASYPLTVSFNGNGNTCSVTLEVTTPLPTGAIASFSPNPISGTSSAPSTLSISTSAATSPGTYSFTVKANSGTDCQNQNSNPIVIGSLTVNAKLNQATVNVINMPASPQQFGASFTVGASGGSGTGVYNFAATGACTVGLTSGVVNITGSAGTCSITATRVGDANFNDSAPSTAATVSVIPATQPAVTLTVPSTTAYPTGFTASAGGGVAGAQFTYSTSSLACSVNQTSGVVTIISVGTCAITATATAANYADATDTKSTTITAGTQPAVTLTLPATTTFPTGVTASAAGGAAGATFSYSTLSSACAVNASTGVVTINSVGSCAITATATAANYNDATDTKTMTIDAAATTTVVTVANATFDGSPHGGTAQVTGPAGLSQSLTVSYVGRNGTTYPLSTTAPTNAGDYTASASYAAAGNYLGSTDSQDFSIGKASSSTAVTCPNTATTFTGSPLTPCTAAATGAGGLNQTLTPTYSDNTNVGTATANASFAGDANHEASNGSATFAISKAASVTAVSCPATPTTYTGSPLTPCTATATGAGGLSAPVTPSYSNNTNVGTATANASFAGDANHEASSGTANFEIGKAASVTAVSCPATPTTYTGSPLTPCTAVATGAGGLSESLTPTYTDNTNAGTASASASFAGDANHTGSNDTKTFEISKAASVTAVTCPATATTYTGSPLTPCTAAATGAGGLNQTLTPSYTNNTNAGTASANASFGGDANHEASNGSANFEISKASSLTTVSCPNTATTYTGSPLTPCTAAATGVGGLNAPLTPSYSNNVNAGTASANASFAGDENHEASTGSATFEISKAASVTAVSCPATPITYTGSPITPCTAAATGAGGLNQSLTPSYTNNTNAGTATADASFGGDANHEASSGSATFAISKAASVTAVSCPATATTYTGSAITPCTASATGVGGLNESLTPSYTNNVNVGTASASASFGGDANHEGSSNTATFEISKAPSVTAVTCPATPTTYTGSPITPCTATATGAGGLNESLTLSYTNNTNAGTATADASFGGDANHTGSSDSKTFEISKASSLTTVTCPATPTTYTGSELTPCTAKATGVGGLDQTLTPSYSNNVDAGTANVNASFAGDANHEASSGSSSFVISKAASVTTVSCPATITYTGSPLTPCTAAATGAGGLNATLTPTYSNNTNAGTASANASFAGDANHEPSNNSATFEISKAASVTAVTCPATPTTYTGSPITPCTATATGAGGLNESVTPTYTNNTNAGTATADASFAGDANHTGSTGQATFEISKASSLTTVTCPATPTTYTGSPLTPCTAAATGAGGLNQSLTPTYSNNINAGTATANASFAGDANHEPSNNSATFEIGKAASVTAVSCPASPTTYTGDPLTPCTAAATGAGGLNQSLTPSYTNNTNAGTASASASFAGDVNHEASNGSAPFVISQAISVTMVSCPASVTYTGSPLTPCTAAVTGAGGLSQSLTPSYMNNTNAGTATASASYAGDVNHTASNDSKPFTINKATIAAAILSDLVKGYNGFAQKPTVTTAPTGVHVTLEFKQDGAVKGGNGGVIPVGVYNVLATIDDPNYTGPSSDALFVIYDPTGGFVTGGGWIDSPPNSYTADLSLTGKANFGFVSKYQKGANVPTGNTEFQFKEGNLNFKSTNFQWLVIQGTSQAQFKGTGTINGTGNYNFMVTVVDGDAMNGTKKPDTFRIKITQGTDVIYDNKMTTSETSFDGTTLGGGSIQIQTK